MGTGRKRSADPKSWKRNKVKKLRNSVCFYILQIYILYKNHIFMTVREKSILIISEIQLFKVIDECFTKKYYNKISDDIKKTNSITFGK
jgi:hypothetical protein